MDETRAYFTEWSKSGREKQLSFVNAYIWNLERGYWWNYLKGSSGDIDMENDVFWWFYHVLVYIKSIVLFELPGISVSFGGDIKASCERPPQSPLWVPSTPCGKAQSPACLYVGLTHTLSEPNRARAPVWVSWDHVKGDTPWRGRNTLQNLETESEFGETGRELSVKFQNVWSRVGKETVKDACDILMCLEPRGAPSAG